MTTVPPNVGAPPYPAPAAAPWLTDTAPVPLAGQPSLGGPAGPAAGQGGSRRTLFIGGAVVVAGAVVIAVATGGSGGRSPVEVVQAHADAYADGDWGKAYELLCADKRENYDDAASYGKRMAHKYGGAHTGATLNGKVKQKDDGDVKVGVTLHTVFGDADRTVDVVLEDGEYRVCDNLLG